jgi:hypothetical protein
MAAGKYLVFDGTNWCDPCDKEIRMRSSDGYWRHLDPITRDLYYFDGTSWQQITCGLDCGESLPEVSGSKGIYYVPLFMGKNTPAINIHYDPAVARDSFAIVSEDRLTTLVSSGYRGRVRVPPAPQCNPLAYQVQNIEDDPQNIFEFTGGTSFVDSGIPDNIDVNGDYYITEVLAVSGTYPNGGILIKQYEGYTGTKDTAPFSALHPCTLINTFVIAKTNVNNKILFHRELKDSDAISNSTRGGAVFIEINDTFDTIVNTYGIANSTYFLTSAPGIRLQNIVDTSETDLDTRVTSPYSGLNRGVITYNKGITPNNVNLWLRIVGDITVPDTGWSVPLIECVDEILEEGVMLEAPIYVP